MKVDKHLYLSQGHGVNEHNDCTVRAFSTATDLPYDIVHELFRSHGRVDHQSVTRLVSYTIFSGLGLPMLRPKEPSTLARFARSHPKGNFIVYVRKHALAVKDGVVHDWYKSPSRIVEFVVPVDDFVTDKEAAQNKVLDLSHKKY